MYMFSVTRKIRVSRALLLILYVLFIICGCLSIWLQLALVVKNELILQIGVDILWIVSLNGLYTERNWSL